MLFNVRVTMVLNYTLILLCFFANILYSHSFSELIGTNFVRKGNYFEVTDGNDTEGIPEGYLEKLENLIQDYKAGKIQYEALNTFSRGLQEYYYFVFAEKKISGFPEIPKIPTSDPISLSNYYNDSIKIVNVSAYGFPGFKQPTIETASSSYQMKAALSFKSDVTILTGNFEIFNSSYFFVYTLKQSVYKEYSRMPRNTLKDIEITNLSLRFSSEELLHTYDSSYPRYAQANEIFVQHFNAAFLKHFLPILFTRSYQSNTKSFMEMHAQYVRTYKKLILSAVSEAVILYSTAKGLNSFELAPVNFTKSVGSQVLEQQYKDIKVDGILNFVNNELINSTMKLFESNKRYQVKLYVTIQLTYADEGEKQAFVSFVINDGGGKNSKKFKIKNIQITSIWVSTHKGDFLDGITFFVEFQLRDFDPTYEFLVRYIGDEITRAFMQTLKESKDLLSEPDINNSRS